MTRNMLMATLIAAAIGCGDDGGTPPDANGDAPRPNATFTGFVIDLIEKQTADNTDPVELDFDLSDPDQDNATAYDPLFQ